MNLSERGFLNFEYCSHLRANSVFMQTLRTSEYRLVMLVDAKRITGQIAGNIVKTVK